MSVPARIRAAEEAIDERQAPGRVREAVSLAVQIRVSIVEMEFVDGLASYDELVSVYDHFDVPASVRLGRDRAGRPADPGAVS